MNLRLVKNLLKIWTKFEDVLDTFQPPSRRAYANSPLASNLSASIHHAENHHEACRSIFHKIDDCRTMEQIKDIYVSRYRKLNVHSNFRHQTLEVRHHSGTTDPEKITNWVRLMSRGS